jgi:hypothetical protein
MTSTTRSLLTKATKFRGGRARPGSFKDPSNFHRLWDAYFDSKQMADADWEYHRAIYEDGGFVGPEPSGQQLNRTYWSVIYESRDAAISDQVLLNTALGFDPKDSVLEGEKWARRHDYVDPYPPLGARHQATRPTFEDIKAQVPIETVLEKMTDLRWSGFKARGRCPFHDGNDKASLSVDKTLGLFHCFSCQVGGDVIELVRTAMERKLM